MISKLFKWNRFDLPAKYLYAKFRQNKINSDFGLEIYKEHLKLMKKYPEYVYVKRNVVRKDIGMIVDFKYKWKSAYESSQKSSLSDFF